MPHDHLPRFEVVTPKRTPLRLAYDDFLLSRQVMRCTPKTMTHYRYSVGGFIGWLESQHVDAPQHIHARHVLGYLAFHSDRGVKDTTLHVHARGVRTFLRFLHTEKYIAEPIAVQMPRLDRKRLPFLSADDLRRVLAFCKHPRDHALVLLMVDSGLRLAETSALDWGDVDIRSGLVRVLRGKGGKARSVVIGATTRRALLAYRRWWVQAFQQEPQAADALWISVRNGERLLPNGIQLLCQRLSRTSGVKVSPHALRRTFATLSLRAGMSPLHLQGLLGHASLEMVRRYAAIVDDDLKQAHERYGPVDHLL